MSLRAVFDALSKPGHRQQFAVRPLISFGSGLIITLALLLSVGSLRVAALYQQYNSVTVPLGTTHASATHSAGPATPVAAPAPAAPAAVSSPAPVTHPAVTVSIPAPIPNCTPMALAVPAAVSLTAAAAGLTTQIDPAAQYQIYGNNPSDLRQQIQHCAPGNNGTSSAEYTAQTDYMLTWQYDYTSTNNVCAIATAKVGLHVTQDLPLWQPTGSAQAGLAARWSAFASNLVTHENGHTALDVQYAQKLSNDLQTLPATDCSQLSQVVKQLTDSAVASLNQANDAYDTATNHGATQGAVLPQ